MSRRPTREAAVRREIDAFVRQEDTFTAGTDVEARLARVDFPLFMVTDDAGGAPEAALTSREQYLSEMKPFWDTMPRDAKFTHKLAITVLSDSLAAVTDDYTMSVRGKRVVGARNSAVLVKRAGQWKWKSMVEAGWGGMSAPDAATAAPPPAPAPAHSAPPPVPAPHGPAPAPAPAPAPRR
jgi:hypothetical protein